MERCVCPPPNQQGVPPPPPLPPSMALKAADLALGIPRVALRTIGKTAELGRNLSMYVGAPIAAFFLYDGYDYNTVAKLDLHAGWSESRNAQRTRFLRLIEPLTQTSQNKNWTYKDTIEKANFEIFLGYGLAIACSLSILSGKRIKNLTYRMADAIKLIK